MPKKPPTHPLLVRSYQLYRLSPLHNFPSVDPAHHPSPLTNAPPITKSITSPFKPHERAISNSLRGDVLRGVTVADGDNSDTTAGGKLAGLGRFKACRWRLVPTFSALRDWVTEMGQEDDDEDEDEDEDENDEDGVVDKREWQKAVREREDVAGVEITFEYERGVSGYVAYLLCPPVASPSKSTSKAENGSAFTQFPLLLARLPKALVEVLFEYLTVTFDTLPLPMGLIGGGENNSTYNSTGWLGEMLEMYLSHQKSNGGGKDVTLVFRPPGIQGLKTLTISIRSTDIEGFMKYGKTHLFNTNQIPEKDKKKRKRSTEDGDDDEPSKKSKGPFFTAVARYMQGTMGMDMDQLHLTKVACAGFVIGGGGGGGAIIPTATPATATTTTTNGPSDVPPIKSKPDYESTSASGRIKIFAPRKLRPGEVNTVDEDEERSGQEIAVDKFMASLLELATSKGSVLTTHFNTASPKDAGGEAGARKRKANTRSSATTTTTTTATTAKTGAGKVPGGRIKAF